MAKNTVIAVGVALALAVPGASALAAGGGQGRAHHATPPPGTHGRTGDVPGIHGAAQGRGAAQSQRVRQFEGVIVAVDQDSLALRVQGSAGVTVTVDLSTTGTRVTADDVVTTTAALVSGEQGMWRPRP